MNLQQALSDAGTGDVGLLGHALAKYTTYSIDGCPQNQWDAIKDKVKQHVHWHTDPLFTAHALPGGREKITEGPSLNDPVVYEDPE